jgi:predicted acyltransferase
VLEFCQVALKVPESAMGQVLCHHQSDLAWVGCVLNDTIQAGSSFLVGVALPFSIANRLARGQSQAMITARAFSRSLVLIFLGIFLRSGQHRDQIRSRQHAIL